MLCGLECADWLRPYNLTCLPSLVSAVVYASVASSVTQFTQYIYECRCHCNMSTVDNVFMEAGRNSQLYVAMNFI